MPSRICRICVQEHAITKAYSLGVYEHVVIQDPALNAYVCELCRSCVCQGCGRAFVAPSSSWSKHLLIFGSSTEDACARLCQACAASADAQGAAAVAGLRRTAASMQAEFGKLVQQRGSGPMGCAACLAAFAAWGPLQPSAAAAAALDGGGSPRFQTDPLLPEPSTEQQQPQHVAAQQQQQQDYPNIYAGQATNNSCPGRATSTTLTSSSAQDTPLSPHPIDPSSTVSSSSSGRGGFAPVPQPMIGVLPGDRLPRHAGQQQQQQEDEDGPPSKPVRVLQEGDVKVLVTQWKE